MKKYVCNIVIAVLFISAGAVVKASDQSDVRATVQNVFEQLKSHNYEALYDFLPDASRSRMSCVIRRGALSVNVKCPGTSCAHRASIASAGMR